MADRSARQTRAARERRRRTWDGDSLGAMAEKDGVGLFLDDLGYAFADVSAFSIPVLYLVMVTEPADWYGAKTAAMAAWFAAVAVGAVIRGGWVTPPATDAPGWVSMTPLLALLRIGYFNAALALGAYGGGALAPASPAGSVAFAALVGALAAALFPRVAETAYGLAG